MNRSNFIKSIALLLAAPTIIGDLNKINTDPKEKRQIAFWCKISNELENDPGFKTFIEQEVIYGCEKHGIDLSKPYNIRVGWENDDFIKNTKTILVTQYV